MNRYSVIVKAIITEKSNDLREKEGKYTFEVRMAASKEDIKKAVSEMWKVEVASVTTAIRRGKTRRRGRHLVKPKLSKRAIVSLKNGAKLPLFEEQ